MSKHVLKAVALAVGAFIAGSVQAQVNIDATSPTTVKYANEQNIGTAPWTLRDGAAATQTATTAFGASFGTDVAAYVRVEVAGGTLTGTVPTTMFAVAGSNGAATVSVAQSGAGFVIFAVTPLAGGNLVAANLASIDTDVGTLTGITVTDKAGVTLRYRLFETLTAAANPASNNTLKDTGAKPYIAFANAFSATLATANAIADVAASPSYTAFTGPATTRPLGTTTFTFTPHALASGAASSLATIFGATTTITAGGDFFLARNDDTTYTGAALGRVRLSTTTDCTAGFTSAATLTQSAATFTVIDTALTGTLTLCLTAEGTPEISPASYTLATNYVEETGFTVADTSALAAGNITRNGVRMVAPLFNQPAGWFSRLVMTNTGSGVRDYSISYLTETGTTIVATGVGSAGTLAAGKTTIIDLPSVVTITPGAGLGARASLVVTVNAPQSEIDGLYQGVSPTGGTITNYVLVYKN